MIDDEAQLLTLPSSKTEPYICDDAPVVVAAPEMKLLGITVFLLNLVCQKHQG